MTSESLLTIYRGDSVSQALALRRSQLPLDLSSVYDVQVTLANDPDASEEQQTFSKLTREITVDDETQGLVQLAISPEQTEDLLVQEKSDLDVVVVNQTAQTAFTASTQSGQPTLSSVSSFANVAKGRLITGTGIPSGTLVTDFDEDAATITLSKNATATGTAVTMTPTLLENQTYRVPNGLTVRDRST